MTKYFIIVLVRGRRERAPILIRRYDDEEVDSSRDRMRISDPGKAQILIQCFNLYRPWNKNAY